MKTDDLINELNGLKAECKALRAAIHDKQKAWADAMNLRLGIPADGIDAGMWGHIFPCTAMHCHETFDEHEIMAENCERIEEIQEQLKYQPQADAFAAITEKLNCTPKIT